MNEQAAPGDTVRTESTTIAPCISRLGGRAGPRGTLGHVATVPLVPAG